MRTHCPTRSDFEVDQTGVVRIVCEGVSDRLPNQGYLTRRRAYHWFYCSDNMNHFFLDGVSAGIFQGEMVPTGTLFTSIDFFFWLWILRGIPPILINLVFLHYFNCDAIRLISEGIPASASVFRGSIRGFLMPFEITWDMSSLWVTTYCLSCFKRVALLERTLFVVLLGLIWPSSGNLGCFEPIYH